MTRPPLDREEREIREEIGFYLEERARELEAQGLSPAEARRLAREAFGDPDRIAERVRAARGASPRPGARGLAATLLRDLRHALRGLLRQPLFAAAAVLTLALAIGANAAIFGVADATLLRRPPVSDPAGLVAVYTTCRAGEPRCASSYPDYLDYRAGAPALADLAAFAETPLSVAVPGEAPRLVGASLVSGNYFGLLGLAPAAGRLLHPEDDRPGATAPVAVLAYDSWARDFGADAGVVGRTLHLNQVPYEIVGVAPRGFRGITLAGDPYLFLPLTARDLLGVNSIAGVPIWEVRDVRWIDQLVGRLAPGASVDLLRAQAGELALRLNATYPDARGERRVTVDPATRYVLPGSGRTDLTRLVAVLGALVALTLLLAAANVANLLLARAAVRRREMGVRLALGSGAGALVRQLLVESLVLATLGGVAALAVAVALLRLLSGFELPGGVPVALLDVGVDGRVFAFALALSTATGVAFGLAPALRASGRDLVTSLRSGGAASGRERDRLRGLLVAAQVGISLVLLSGAALFLRGLREGLAYELGARPEGLALARFDFSLLARRAGAVGYQDADALARLDAILERVEALPRVTSAAVSTTVPLQGRSMGFFVTVDGYQPAPDEEMRVEMAFASERFFRTLGTGVRSGRDVDAAMSAGAEPQVIVNRTMAEAYWPGGRAEGGVVRWRDLPLRVVGVTEDAAWRTVPQPPLNFLTVSLRQFPQFATNGSLTLLVRTGGDPEALLEPLRSIVLEVDPNLAVEYVQTMEDVLGAELSPQRMGALLFTAFGALALVLSFVGIAGVVAYLVGRRKREIGIRVALGASGAQVQAGAMRELLVPVGFGLAGGLALAWMLGRSVQRFLIDASAASPGAYLAAVALLAAVAFAAAWLPARRAARVDPVQVLQAE